jgi:hypothetical protein
MQPSGARRVIVTNALALLVLFGCLLAAGAAARLLMRQLDLDQTFASAVLAVGLVLTGIVTVNLVLTLAEDWFERAMRGRTSDEASTHKRQRETGS